jgi:hypothetical protein
VSIFVIYLLAYRSLFGIVGLFFGTKISALFFVDMNLSIPLIDVVTVQVPWQLLMSI